MIFDSQDRLKTFPLLIILTKESLLIPFFFFKETALLIVFLESEVYIIALILFGHFQVSVFDI